MAPTAHRSVAGPRRASPDALLVLDMISCWDFPDAGHLLPHALHVTPRIARLCTRAREHAVPVIYGNDNRGQWRSDFRQLVAQSLEGSDAARTITHALMPSNEDYFVLKPQHSAFYATPLQLLLETLGVRRLVITGVATDQCVLHTAMDARMRGLDVTVPSDTCATQDAARQQRALRQFTDALQVATPLSAAFRWAR
ncbi:cysteine hydrolase family protein [Piscinibacter terrae]|uniref:Cysteine hydrolase n=1 Tax=Piscinibacter terrae TaxID=2496871 RepID=A0A3N7JNW6_9BURK|nr:isochorismatase family cysteine hydrolase [Albitalea terrae]RQP22809.1 cysteine hydrolase [Albitalea terrae]